MTQNMESEYYLMYVRFLDITVTNYSFVTGFTLYILDYKILHSSLDQIKNLSIIV